MIKRIINIALPSYLSLKNEQLSIAIKDKEGNLVQNESLPVEDLGMVLIDHPQVSLSVPVLNAFSENDTGVVICDNRHMPNAMFLPFAGNTLATDVLRKQIKMSLPLRKNLWAQTVSAKIHNQALFLQTKGIEATNMCKWVVSVRSGDPSNLEGRAAAYYWGKVFPDISDFSRDPEGLPPNNLLNYGYAVLRAIVARGIVGSGLHPSLGLFHSNKYNAFCLADDLMEPYRPYVDNIVWKIVNDGLSVYELSKEIKQRLLSISSIDVVIEGKRSPLMVGLQRTTASLVHCIKGEVKKIIYPVFSDED